MIGDFLILAAKDLRLHWNGKEHFVSLLMFASCILVLFHFGLPSKDLWRFAPGIYWVAAFFCSVLALQRLREADRRDGVAFAVLLAPVSRAMIYLARVVSLCVFLMVLQLCLAPLVALVFGVGLWGAFADFFAVAFLASFGIAANGVLVSALAGEARFSEILVPILLFPVLIPVFVSALQLTSEVWTVMDWRSNVAWLKLLIAYDLIFLSVGLTLFEPITRI